MCLVRGQAFASVDVDPQGDARVTFWRDGATFGTAPLSPYMPGPVQVAMAKEAKKKAAEAAQAGGA